MNDYEQSLGELRITLNALWKRIAEMEKRIRDLEQQPTMTGAIQGMSESVTITVPEGWFA